MEADGSTQGLDASRAMMLPVQEGRAPAVTFLLDVTEATTLEIELRASSRHGNFTPDETLSRQAVTLTAGPAQMVYVSFDVTIDSTAVCLLLPAAKSSYLGASE